MSIEDRSKWLGSRWGDFPPWGTVARTDIRTGGSKSDLNRQKLRKGFIYRTFGGSLCCLKWKKRPFAHLFPFATLLYIFRKHLYFKASQHFLLHFYAKK